MTFNRFLKARPVTAWLIIGVVGSFVMNFFLLNTWLPLLSFDSTIAHAKIWTIITYPFAQNDAVSLLFSGLWMFTIGSILEEHLSTIYYSALLSLSIVVTPIVLHFVNLFHPIFVQLSGFWVPLSFLTIFWGSRYPNQQVVFSLLFPIKAILLAYITIGLVFFSFRDPFIAVTMLVPSLAFFYGGRFMGYGIAMKKREDHKFKSYINEVNQRKKRREEDEKLRKLFEKSFDNKDQ